MGIDPEVVNDFLLNQAPSSTLILKQTNYLIYQEDEQSQSYEESENTAKKRDRSGEIIAQRSIDHTAELAFLDATGRRFSLCRKHSADQKADYVMTTYQMINMMIGYITRHMHVREVVRQYLVVGLDKKAYVPKEKGEEQAKRIHASQWTPYHDDFHLEDTDTQMVHTGNMGATSTRLLKEMMGLIEKRFIYRYMNEKRPFPLTIILDYQDDGVTPPVVFYPDGKVQYKKEFLNQIGEAELLPGFYASQLHPRHVVVYSADTDHLPAGLRYLSIPENYLPESYIWIRDGLKPKVQKGKPLPTVYGIDLHALYHWLQFDKDKTNTTGLNTEAFLLGCVLCGCDYYDKADVSHQFGMNTIMKTIASCWKEILKITENREIKHKFIHILHRVIVTLYESRVAASSSEYSDWTTLPLIEALPRLALALQWQPKYHPPSIDVFMIAAKKFKFTWFYWIRKYAEPEQEVEVVE